VNQAKLYDAIAKAGCTVLEFSDHPGFFGSWYVIVKRKGLIFRISEDGRECQLAFSKKNPSNEWELLQAVDSTTFDEQETIAASTRFLSSFDG
jgi:hypothetical protein